MWRSKKGGYFQVFKSSSLLVIQVQFIFNSFGTGTTIRHQNQPRVLAPGTRVLKGGTGAN
jgi:hypothetical protein